MVILAKIGDWMKRGEYRVREERERETMKNDKWNAKSMRSKKSEHKKNNMQCEG